MLRTRDAKPALLEMPWRGLNIRDLEKPDKSGFASILDNYLAGERTMRLRKGSLTFASDLPAPVHSAFYWAAGGSEKYFGIADNAIYDLTAGGSIGAPFISSLNSNHWTGVNFAAGGGNVLVLSNGADPVKNYTGTWSNASITGVDPETLFSVTSHQNRLWFAKKETLDAYYLGVKAISGAASVFPLGSVFDKGGTLKAIGTWSVDGGRGMDDTIVFATSEGQYAIYQGINPADDSTFSLIGVYDASPPFNERCMAKRGSDLMILTTAGVVSMRSLMRGGTGLDNISKYINPAIVGRATTAFDDNISLSVYQLKNWMIINLPDGEGGFEQYVQNGAIEPPYGWSRFKGLNAYSWMIAGDRLFFGNDGGLVRADTGHDDDGEVIRGQIRWSWDDYGSPLVKNFLQSQIHYVCNGAANLTARVNADYREGAALMAIPQGIADDESTWDSLDWDTWQWSPDVTLRKEWKTTPGLGNVGALEILSETKGIDLALLRAQILYRPAGLF